MKTAFTLTYPSDQVELALGTAHPTHQSRTQSRSCSRILKSPESPIISFHLSSEKTAQEKWSGLYCYLLSHTLAIKVKLFCFGNFYRKPKLALVNKVFPYFFKSLMIHLAIFYWNIFAVCISICKLYIVPNRHKPFISQN